MPVNESATGQGCLSSDIQHHNNFFTTITQTYRALHTLNNLFDANNHRSLTLQARQDK